MLASAMLRSASDSVPLWRARERLPLLGAQFKRHGLADHGALAVLFLRRLVDRKNANICEDDLRIDDIGRAAAVRILLAPREDDIDPVVGQNKPPAPVSGGISVEMARMPVGRIAAMKPDPLALTSFGSRIGSSAMSGARAIEPATWVAASGRSLRRMKLVLAVVAGQACH
jgi:hypothetical protein